MPPVELGHAYLKRGSWILTSDIRKNSLLTEGNYERFNLQLRLGGGGGGIKIVCYKKKNCVCVCFFSSIFYHPSAPPPPPPCFFFFGGGGGGGSFFSLVLMLFSLPPPSFSTECAVCLKSDGSWLPRSKKAAELLLDCNYTIIRVVCMEWNLRVWD